MPSTDEMKERIEQALPGARLALVLLLTINFFNYVDRQVLAAVESQIETSFFPSGENPRSDVVVRALDWVLSWWLDPSGTKTAYVAAANTGDYSSFYCYLELGVRRTAKTWPAADRFLQGPCR